MFFPLSLPSCHNWDHVSPFVSPVLTNYGVPIYRVIALILLNTWITRAQKAFIAFSPTNMLRPCELLTWETAFNRLHGLCPRSASKIFSAPWGCPFFYASLSPVLGLGFSALGKTFIFLLNNRLFVAPKRNFIHNKWCKNKQWQPLICMRITKPSTSTQLTVNSSLPRLLAELLCLRVYKFFANLYMHRSEAQITDGTAPHYRQVDFNSEHLPEVSLPPRLGCTNLILCCTPLVLLWEWGTPFKDYKQNVAEN